jgi:hypothetical protein
MSLTPSASRVAGVSASAAPRRVRDQARDVVVLMAFSAVVSTAVAAALLLLTHLARAGR